MVRSPPPAEDKTPCAPFHSQPSDLELIKSYLRPWVDSGIKKAAFVHVTDVYADEPAELTRQFAPVVAQDGERAWYFLTPLRRKANRGKRKARIVLTGEGCWHSEAKSRPVVDAFDGRRQVGYRQSFTFMKFDERGLRTRTGWLMLELGLRAERDHAEEGRVLCKVYRSPRYPGERKREAGDGEYTASPALLPKRKTDDDDGSEASQDDTAGRRKSDGEGSSAATVAAPRKADDDEIPVTATVAAPGRNDKEADDGDSAETSAAVPGSKRKAADDESSVAASAADPARSKSKIDSGLHCPNCGCHLNAEALLAAAAKSKPEMKSDTGIVHVEGDSFVIEHSFHQFF